MNKFAIIAMILVGLFIAFKMMTGARESVKLITASELKQAKQSKEKFVLVDVREDSEWASGKINGASHLKLGLVKKQFEKKFPNVKKDDKIIMYCRSGQRSETSSLMLKDLGFTNVFSLKGGIMAYGSN